MAPPEKKARYAPEPFNMSMIRPVLRKVVDPTLDLYKITYTKMDIERSRKSMFALPPFNDSKTIHAKHQRYSDLDPKICNPPLELYWPAFPEELWPDHVKKALKVKAINEKSKAKEIKFHKWLPILEEKTKTEFKSELVRLKQENFDSKSWDTKVDLLESVYKQMKTDETEEEYMERICQFEKQREDVTEIVRLEGEVKKEEEDDDDISVEGEESDHSDGGDYGVDHYNDSDDGFGDDGDDDDDMD